MPAFRLAHISDLHLAPRDQAGGGFAAKRLLSRFAWRRKQHRHSPDALAAIVADLVAARPDHIAITGDLTNFSTPGEFAAARRWLEDLAPAEDVTVSPGNHDALVGAPGHARFEPWRPWLGDEAAAVFPQVRRRGPVALVNLCSATPTALHLAEGVLDEDQLARLPALLSDLGAAGCFRVVLLHHPPVAGLVSRRKSLRQGPALGAILKAQGAELVLHGHAHEATVASLEGPQGAIPVLGVPSASSRGAHGEGARWHELSIEPVADGWRVQVTARGPDRQGRPRPLGRYALNLASADSASSPGSSARRAEA